MGHDFYESHVCSCCSYYTILYYSLPSALARLHTWTIWIYIPGDGDVGTSAHPRYRHAIFTTTVIENWMRKMACTYIHTYTNIQNTHKTQRSTSMSISHFSFLMNPPRFRFRHRIRHMGYGYACFGSLGIYITLSIRRTDYVLRYLELC